MAPLGQLRPPNIAGPAIPSTLLQPTVHRSFRTLQASRLYRSRRASHPHDPEPGVPAAHIHRNGAASRFWTLQAEDTVSFDRAQLLELSLIHISEPTRL